MNTTPFKNFCFGLFLFLLTFLTFGCNKRNIDFISYTENLIGIKVSDICEGSKGEIEPNEDGVLASLFSDDYAYIRLSLTDKGIYTVKERFSKAGRQTSPISSEEIKSMGFNGNRLAETMKSENIREVYNIFTEGKGNTLTGKSMTRSIEIVLTEDEGGNEYLYLFG